MTEPKFHAYDDYLRLPKNPSLWIIDGFLPLGFTNLYAKPKAGKSRLVCSISEAIVNGVDEWNGFPVSQHGNVLYLQIDTPRELWSSLYVEAMDIAQRKFEFYCADMWTTPTYPFNLLQNPKDATLFDKSGRAISDPEWLEKEIERCDPILIVLDTLREAHNEDENESGAMKKVLSALQKAAGKGRGVIIVSHAKKDSMWTSNNEDDMMDQNRGTTYIPGKMDMIIRMTQKELHWKGRAVGYKKAAYKHVQQGFIEILRDKAEEQEQADDIIRLISDNHPGITKNKLAEKLSALTKISVRTAHRRIDEWNSKMERKASKLRGSLGDQLERSLAGQFLQVNQQEKLNLATGEVSPIRRSRGELVDLWNQPLSFPSS